jgi:hypothetical protein
MEALEAETTLDDVVDDTGAKVNSRSSVRMIYLY